MPYIGYVRNGRLNMVKVGTLDAGFAQYKGDRSENEYYRQVRLLDVRVGKFWRIERGNWIPYGLHVEDDTVERMLGEIGDMPALPVQAPVKTVRPYKEPRGVQVSDALPAGQREALEALLPQERAVDLRTHSRGRARREGRVTA